MTVKWARPAATSFTTSVMDEREGAVRSGEGQSLKWLTLSCDGLGPKINGKDFKAQRM